MTDRFTRVLLVVIALATGVLAVRSAGILPIARAQAPPSQRCYWTYIRDLQRPGIGENGKIEFNGDNWRKLSEEGWRLVAFAPPGLYMFERCE